MLVALLFTITALFALETLTNQKNNTTNSFDKLEEVKEKLSANEQNIAQLTANLSEDNLAKTRAFADMLAADKSINGNVDRLNEIKDRIILNSSCVDNAKTA